MRIFLSCEKTFTMSTRYLFITLLSLYLLDTCLTRQVITAYYDAQVTQWSHAPVEDPSGIATAIFYDELNNTGWDRLYVRTNATYSNDLQAYAAGYVEGIISALKINQWHQNFFAAVFGDKAPTKKFTDFMYSQYQWTMVNAYQGCTEGNPEREYWCQALTILQQIQGISDGYNEVYPSQLSVLDMYTLNSAGDLENLVGLYNTENYHGTALARRREFFDEIGLDCSAFIKVTATDLFFGHTTWTEYSSMNRIYKHYELNYSYQSTVARRVGFSSRPGFVSSKDDFYQMDSGLVSQETTLSLANETLYKAVTYKSVLCFMRSVLANRMARNAREWTEIFAKYNSGTYNNQWMVIDLNKYSPGLPIVSGTFWIIEQIPGMTRSADMSSFLEKHGYWPSFNEAYFADIYAVSGLPKSSPLNGQGGDYIDAPRFKIFTRDQAQVTDMAGMMHILQYNDWQHDPLQEGSPENGIASRYDLVTNKTFAFGGIDTKITSYSLMLPAMGEESGPMFVVATSGPTHQGQDPFVWTSKFTDKHVGQPDIWNFNWRVISSNGEM